MSIIMYAIIAKSDSKHNPDKINKGKNELFETLKIAGRIKNVKLVLSKSLKVNNNPVTNAKFNPLNH